MGHQGLQVNRTLRQYTWLNSGAVAERLSLAFANDEITTVYGIEKGLESEKDDEKSNEGDSDGKEDEDSSLLLFQCYKIP